ncbi:MAG: GHKL domain-containing protein [Deltaproteobacteria bacterium]|nr:GHKL domain-containing protein [Deltaproteobacteria bacterium]
MAGLLWFKAEKSEGVNPLILSCLGVAFWVSGHILINTGSGDEMELGRALVNLSPLVAAFFVHFALVFTGYSRRPVLYANYGIAAAAALTGSLSLAGNLRPWSGFNRFYQFDDITIGVAAVTALYCIFGHLWLLRARGKAEPKRRMQITAVLAAGAWGLFSASAFLFGSLDMDIFPFPVFMLPGYAIILVYGVLRYEFKDVNLWASKSLAWGFVIFILLGLISLVTALLASIGLSGFIALPLWQIWVGALLVFVLTLALYSPALNVAAKLIYPGSRINAAILKKWQEELEGAENWRDLSTRGTNIMCEHLGYTVEVKASPGAPELYSNKPGIVCDRQRGIWNFKLAGWEEAAPGIIRTAEVFGALLKASSVKLDDALRLAEREKAVLRQKHLSDLGRLSATVAHEMRNPLNIISTASAGCDAEIKKEITHQLGRAQKLIGDLLTYSGDFKIEKRGLNLKEEAEYIASHYNKLGSRITIEVPEEITIQADSHRLHQVFFNLLDNASIATREKENPLILVHAAKSNGMVRVKVYDNGPGISDKIKDDIFSPFVSGRPGGNGLGLAIVERIMEAHGGSIELQKKNNWSCCFELQFPLED